MVSPDIEFGVNGARSGIPYQKFAHAYKKMLIDGSREGTQHSQRTMDHFNAIVFKGTVTAKTCDEDADSSEIDLGMNDLSFGDDDSPSLTSTNHITPQPSSPGNPMTISQASAFHHPSSHLSSNQHAHPAPQPSNSEVIPHSHISANSSYPTHSSSQQLTNSVRLPDSRQRLTPTASISAAPPPIIDPELQYDSDDDIMPLPEQSIAGPSPVRDDEVVAQPAAKGKRKARAKFAKPQAEPSESGPVDMHDALPMRRSARAGQKSKSGVP